MPRAPDHFSVSQLTLYLQCPRKYRFRYIDGCLPEHRAPAMLLGSAVHSGVAWWWGERQEGREPPLESVLRIFRADWTAAITDPVPVAWDGQTPKEARNLGEGLVRLFVERFALEPVPEAVEARFEVPLRDPATGQEVGLPLVGYLDFAQGGTLYELKTCARKTSPSNWSLQLAAYAWASEQTTGRPPQVRVVELIKTKEPKIEVLDAHVSPKDLLFFLEVATEAIQSIRSHAFHPNPGWYCASCEYRHGCREGGAAAKAA